MWQASTIFLNSWILMMTFSSSAEPIVSAVLRDNATILCSSFANTEISWFGPDESGQMIRYTNQGQTLILNSVPRRNRLHVKVVTLSSNISSLIIANTMKTDAGTYACNNGKDEHKFTVQVTDPDATLYVTEGTQSVLICNLTSVINSSHWIGPPGATVYNKIGSTTLNFNGLPAEFVSRIAVDPTTGALVINNTQRSDDNLYKCNVGGHIHYVKLTVLASPRNPVIINTTANIESGRKVLWATEDIQIAIVCHVRGGNPESSVKWLRGGLNGTEIPTSYSSQRNADGTYDVTSQVFVMARRSDDRVTYVCQAKHRTWTSPKRDSVELYVRLKPSEPVMSDPDIIQENATLSLTCWVSRCRPAATITWSGDGTYLTNIIEDKNTETFNVTSAYNKTVSRQDNGATIQCTIIHPALSRSLVTSRKLTVRFYPTNVSITNNREVTAGDKLILMCTTGTSNPIADIRWRNNTIAPTGELSAIMEQPGQYGGKIGYQNLTITPTRYMDGNIITCSAENRTTYVQGVNDSVVISVTFSPVVNVSIAPNNTVTEGDGSITVLCSASSKPLSNFTVRKDGLPTVISEGQGTNENHHYYIIQNVNRTNAGIYSCTADNGLKGPQNEVQATVDLMVHYPPDVNVFGSNVTTNEVYAKLVCVPNGVPDKYTFGTWQHLWPGYKGTLRNLSSTYIEEHNATLDLKSISYQDSGVYECQASNGVKRAGTQEDVMAQLVYVLIKAPPVILKIPKNVAGGIGSLIAFPIEYYSNTDVGHVTLQHSNAIKVYKGDIVEEIQINNLPVYTHYVPAKVYRVNFNISISNKEYFGNYTVNVTNNIGFAVVTLEIKPDSEPRKPYKFDSSNLQKNQITLSWYPGFHGGFDQTFVIQISMDNILWQNASLVPGGKCEELFNTTITELKPNTVYYFRIYAFNIKGNGEMTDGVISGKTLSELEVHQSTSPQTSTIIGGAVGGCFAALALTFVLILFLRRRTSLSDKCKGREHTQRKRPESGLVDNPVYDTSGPLPGPSADSSVAEYALVVKPRKTATQNPKNVHAQVNKKGMNKFKGASKGKRGKKSREDIYENVDLTRLSTNPDNIYENSGRIIANPFGENVYEDSGTATLNGLQVNEEGSDYADLELNPPETINGKPLIRGVENRTEYAVIAYGKVGKPLPDSDEE